MPALPDDQMDGFYRFLWTGPENDPARFAFLDEDLGGRRSSDMLREHAMERGVGPGTIVLDAGCGKGRHACMLANEFGCQVVALDLLERNLRLARMRVEVEAVSGAVHLVRGSLQALPLRDEQVDFVWCGDMFNLLTDPERALRECARVLRPGGTLMIYTALAREPLGSDDVTRLCAPMAVNPATLSTDAFTAAAARSGLSICVNESTFAVTSRHFEPITPDMGRDVMRYARLLRAKERVIDRLGEDACRWLEAYYLWNVYLLMGRLTYHVWALEK